MTTLVDDLEDFADLVAGFEDTNEWRTLYREVDGLAKSGRFDEAFEALESGNELITAKLIDAGESILMRQDFQYLSKKLRAEIVRYQLSGGLVVGYGASARLTSSVITPMNVASGVLQPASLPTMDQDRVKGIVAETINYSMDDKHEAAASFFSGAGDSFVKSGSIDVQVASAVDGIAGEFFTTEFKRNLGARDACDVCVSMANRWVDNMGSIDYWHDRCRCSLHSRRGLAV